MSVFIPNTSGARIAHPISGNNVILTPGDWTMMCWVQFNSLSARRGIMGLETNFYIELYTDGVTSNFCSALTDFTGPALNHGVWYHLAMTIRSPAINSHYIIGYINGQQVVTTAQETNTWQINNGYSVGNIGFSSFNNNYPLDGQVRDARWWNRLLPPNEIFSEMKSRRPNQKGLVVWLPLDEDIFTDRSGHGYIMTATGSPSLQNSYITTSYPSLSSGKMIR